MRIGIIGHAIHIERENQGLGSRDTVFYTMQAALKSRNVYQAN